MVALTSPHGHSARVRLELHAGGKCYALAQIGGGRLIFDQEVILPGTSGEVRACIDEHEQRWKATWDASETPRDVIAAELHEAI